MPSHEAETAARTRPEPITLGVREGLAPSPLPPVRIFLATEPAQHRAERVFVWSVERVRDPSRVYEIHLMKDLAGFDRRRWTTGFTNYRYAIPHFAGAAGRAIYNDVDQIYLADPAELFDTELGDRGYLAIRADDCSVMLLDCARMAEVWSLEAAQREHKDTLLRRAAQRYGPLDAVWNARDGEFEAGKTKCLHYTTLQRQPWRPFPDRFVYRDNPIGDLWHELERSADEARFQIFTRDAPSALYRARPGAGAAPLDSAPEDDLPWLLDERFRTADGPVRAEIACERPHPFWWRRRNGLPTRRTARFWQERFEAAARRFPQHPWELRLRVPGRLGRRRLERRCGGPRSEPPRVWVLTDNRPGNSTQSLGLAEALGWPYLEKALVLGPAARLHNRLLGASRLGVDRRRSDPLEPPWPDLVIAAGRRTAPVARWVQRAAGGAPRLVQLGRKGGDLAEAFDLVVTPDYGRLFPHPHRMVTSGPLHRLRPQSLDAAAEGWRERFDAAARPRIALLVGGRSGQYELDAASARRIGEDVMRMARDAGGSVWASTSRRTGEAAARALREALEGAACVHCFTPDDADNPYLAFLALADALVVTGDSESMLAEATSVGKPVYIVRLPVRLSFRVLRFFREWVVRRAWAEPVGRRDTPRPQGGLEYLCARAIDRGFVRPTRDLDLLHESLIRRGVARRFGEPYAPLEGAPPGERELVAARVRALMGVAPPRPPVRE